MIEKCPIYQLFENFWCTDVAPTEAAPTMIMWNVKESDVTYQCNFCPAYLVKVSNTEYEIMDDKDNICFATL